MENTTTKKKNSTKKTKMPFSQTKFAELLAKNKDAMVDHVFSEAVYLALVAKYGDRGLSLKPSPLDDKLNISAMSESMSPLISILQSEATASFARVFEGMWRDPELRTFFLSKTSSMQGRTGGRNKGYQSPHIEWLEAALISKIAEKNLLKPFTAKEHFRELKLHNDIFSEEADNLIFTEDALKYFGYQNPEPTISLNAVSEALTRINKQKNPNNVSG